MVDIDLIIPTFRRSRFMVGITSFIIRKVKRETTLQNLISEQPRDCQWPVTCPSVVPRS